jgi:hypothetical protein
MVGLLTVPAEPAATSIPFVHALKQLFAKMQSRQQVHRATGCREQG